MGTVVNKFIYSVEVLVCLSVFLFAISGCFFYWLYWVSTINSSYDKPKTLGGDEFTNLQSVNSWIPRTFKTKSGEARRGNRVMELWTMEKESHQNNFNSSENCVYLHFSCAWKYILLWEMLLLITGIFFMCT